MRTGCLLPLFLLMTAPVLRTQSHSVLNPAILWSLRSHTPDIQDQDIAKSSNTPSVLEVALHTLSLPNYVILRLLIGNIPSKMDKYLLTSCRRKTNKEDKNTKYHKWQNLKVYSRVKKLHQNIHNTATLPN